MSDDRFNLDIERILTGKPEYQSDVTSWHGHIPFAFTLINEARPRLFVELGTHKGDSYLAFCQAVRQYGTGTRCFAVDTWKGDEQAGYYDDDVYESLKSMHDQINGDFSSLVRSTFDEALEQFEPASIDLLHIDGMHTYEAVKHDYESWFPKLSDRGIVLFHDICEKGRDFGVWKLWDELTRKYPHFSFLHSHGLGILAVGSNVPKKIIALCNLKEEEAERVRNIYEVVGKSVRYESLSSLIETKYGELENALEMINRLRTEIEEAGKRYAARNEEANNLNLQLIERVKANNDLTAQLTTRDETILGLNSQIASRDETILGLNSQIASRDETILGLNSQIASRDETILGLNSQIASRDETILGLNSQIASRDETINSINLQLAERDEQITYLNKTVTESESSISLLMDELKKSQDSLYHSQEQIMALMLSRSWRITAGLRWLGRKGRTLKLMIVKLLHA